MGEPMMQSCESCKRVQLAGAISCVNCGGVELSAPKPAENVMASAGQCPKCARALPTPASVRCSACGAPLAEPESTKLVPVALAEPAKIQDAKPARRVTATSTT